jgi:hypothetical protein
MVPIMAVVIPATIALVMVVAIVVGVGMMRIDDAAAHGRDGDRHGDEEQATFHGRDLRSVRAERAGIALASTLPGEGKRVNRKHVVAA